MVLKRYAGLLIFSGVLAFAAKDEGPQPRVVTPGGPGKAPSDAVVLFDGHGLSQWTHKDGRPASWDVKDGEIVCKSGTGDIYSKQKFRDAQIHVEFATPNMPQFHSQARANSGVYLQGLYEIQVLDSYKNPTYPDGSCASLYREHAPLVNATLPPEQWQTYDIVFHAPKCDGSGKVTEQGTLTLFHNGVLVQDHVNVLGPTGGADKHSPCEAGPLRLQDHHHPDVKDTFMRFRNIWLRPLD
jgi:hypothetical protein